MVERGAVVSIDAMDAHSDGGDASFWGDTRMVFNGQVSAQGGHVEGNSLTVF